jgi:TonB family protein
MRTAVAALVLGLSLGAVARAADLSDPVWVKAPDRSDWARAYPTQAAQSGLAGSAQVRCAATSAGSLENCAVVAETPTGAGFGAAALSLMGGMELRPTSQSGQLITGKSVLVPIKFTPDVLRPGAVVTNPDWLKKPKPDDFASFWPAAAHGGSGKVVVECKVTNRGLLDKCQVADESPPGRGFGSAALLISQSFLMRPMTVDGQPVGGAGVLIPINFVGHGETGYGGRSYNVVTTAPWSATPTAADLAAAYPKRAIGKVGSGHVVLRCGLKRDGGLTDCKVFSEEPKGEGFADAALSVTRHFQVLVEPKADKVENLLVSVPMDFRDPSQPSPPVQVMDPLWLRTVDPSAVPQLFPPAAVTAGIRKGTATVECRVTQAGGLSECSVVGETPPGLGFGQAALAVATVMQMNPWTAQGTPVDGARIRVPITLKLPDEPAAAPPAKP